MQNENGSYPENPYAPPRTPIGGLDTKRIGTPLRLLILYSCILIGIVFGFGASLALYGRQAFAGPVEQLNLICVVFIYGGGAMGAWIAISFLRNHLKRDWPNLNLPAIPI
ncbi:MAG: hypothetical protein Q8M16_05755 [Pirellulaceae bacterium]|nr:hypothetical protein [Pirellulaceae bacterium]